MRTRAVMDRLRPSWPQAGVLLSFTIAILVLAWPTLRGRTSSVVPSFQTATFPWAANPRGLVFTWPQSDQAESTFPWAVMARRSWRSGDLPLWDPHSFGGGVPWSSDGVAATLYPVRAVLDAGLLPWLAHDLFVLLHLVAAGAGAYWLARRWGAGHLGGTVAGIGWMTNAYVWSWAPLEMVTPFFAFLPLSLAATHMALTRRSRSSVALAGIFLGLGLVAGNVVYSVLTAATCGLYAVAVLLVGLVRARSLRDRDLGRQALAAASLLVLALALSAAALIPTLLNLSRVSRQPFTFEVLSQALLVPWDAYSRLWTRPETPPTAEQLGVQIYLTPVVLALAVLGFLLSRGGGSWSARGLLVLPVLIASTVPGAWVAYHLFPGFDAIRPYARMLPMSLLAAYVLAGLGADRLWALAATRLRGRVRLVVGAALSAGLVGSVFVPAHAVSRSLVPPDRPVTDYPLFPRTPLLRELTGVKGPTGWPVRILPGTAAYATDPPTGSAPVLIGGTASAPGIDTWGGYASAIPEESSDLIRLIAGEHEPDVLGPAPAPDLSHPVYSSSEVDWPLACRLGTDLVVMPPTAPDGVVPAWGSLPGGEEALEQRYDGPDGRVLRLPRGCRSGPYLAAEHVVAESGQAAVDALQSQGLEILSRPRQHDGHVVVLHEESQGSGLSPETAGSIGSATREGRHVTVDVTTDGDMWLVLPVSYDVGWSATVDDESTPVDAVDFNRAAVRVPAGDHQVTLSYWPPGQTPGLVLTLSGLVVVGILLVPRRRRATPTEPPLEP